MGKGQRNRALRTEIPAHERLLAQAARFDKSTRVWWIVAASLLCVLLILPVWSVTVISQNLSQTLYTAEEIAVLAPALSLGRLSLILAPIGTAVIGITLWRRRTALSLIGLGALLVSAVMLVSFAITLGDVFAFNPVLHSGHGQGLDFWDLALRYYSLLIPTVMQIVAICMGFAARKKRDIALVMQQAADTASTLTLGEEEPIEPLS